MKNLKNYQDAFMNENFYIHTYHDNNGYRYKYVYIWRAYTPTGKISKYYHSLQTNKEDGYKKAKLPKLRKGYNWSEPHIYAIHTHLNIK